MVRRASFASQPASAGDRVLVYATGLAGGTDLRAMLAGRDLEIESVREIPERPGLFELGLKIPQDFAEFGVIDLVISVKSRFGYRPVSPKVSLAIE